MRTGRPSGVLGYSGVSGVGARIGGAAGRGKRAPSARTVVLKTQIHRTHPTAGLPWIAPRAAPTARKPRLRRGFRGSARVPGDSWAGAPIGHAGILADRADVGK